MANANLALGVRNLVLDSFDFTTFLDLAILDQKNLIFILLTMLTLLTISILLLVLIFLITLFLLVNINFLIIKSFIVFNIEVNKTNIWLKS